MKPTAAPAAGTSAISAGPISLVIDAPTLPAPNMPSAKPWRWRSAQAAFQAMPTENELPAMPKKNAHTISSVNVVRIRNEKQSGSRSPATARTVRRRPPIRSVRMPSGRRKIDPLSTAIAVSQENFTVSR